MRVSLISPRVLAVVSLMTAVVIGGGANAVLGVCGPFTDVAADTFCPFVLEIFTLGITTGTTPATYDPSSSVSRLQMAAFLSRAVDGVLRRGGSRAAVNQFWTTQNSAALGITSIGSGPRLLKSDGADVWVARGGDGGVVSRVRGSDGKLLETWTGATGAMGVLAAMGRIFVTGNPSPGRLYQIDPSQAAGAVTTVASDLGDSSHGIVFDGSRIWTANFVGSSVSIVTPAATIPWTVTTVTTGFSNPIGALYDGANVWITDNPFRKLFKLDENGAILQTVTVGDGPGFPAFDGTNIWVPNVNSSSVSVVRASTGAVLATLTANGLNGPQAAAFDGQRVLVTLISGDGVALWKAADLTPLGLFGAGSQPFGVCSDGVNFWIALSGSDKLGRF